MQLITERPPGLVCPPVPASAGNLPLTMPDDDVTPRSGAQLAHILGATPINVIGLRATSAAQPYIPPPILPAASIPTAATHQDPSPTPSDEPPRPLIQTTSGPASTIATPTQFLPTTHQPPSIPVVTATTTTAVPLVTATPAATTRAKLGTGSSSSSHRATH